MNRTRVLSLALAVIAITFTAAACHKDNKAAPAKVEASGSGARLAKASVTPTRPPSTTLDVPKKGDAPKVVQNSYGAGGDDGSDLYYRHVRRKLPLVNACYARQRRHDPGLHGKLTVEMTVRPKGDVKDARVVARSINSPPLEGCVVATIKRFHFSPSGAKEPTTLTLPLLFR